MAIDRREFLVAGFSALVLGATPVAAAGRSQRLLSCRSNARDEHFLRMIDSDGRQLLDIRLPARGHGICADAAHERAAVFARRPGDYVWIVDLRTGAVRHRISPAGGRHFYGHGVFTRDGRHLLCTENDFATGQGVIGVYAAQAAFARLGEFASHGIGPHEIRLLAGGDTLVIANGGIRTHPDLPRVKSNLASMQPNLAYVSIDSGRLLHLHEPEAQWHQLSIRHIDVAPDDRVAVAMQFEGLPHLSPPLIALQQGQEPLQMLRAPGAIQRRMKNYCGSVAFDHEGNCLAVSSPRGGLVTYWSAAGDFLGMHDQVDACGIGRSGGRGSRFFVSDGGGVIAEIDEGRRIAAQHGYADCRWDNHMLSLPG